MFHVSQEKTNIVCYSPANALFGKVQCSLITSSQPITVEPLTNNTQSNQRNEKKKEPFRNLFVFLIIYFKYFEGEF